MTHAQDMLFGAQEVRDSWQVNNEHRLSSSSVAVCYRSIL
jgi:hypothetical protein